MGCVDVESDTLRPFVTQAAVFGDIRERTRAGHVPP